MPNKTTAPSSGPSTQWFRIFLAKDATDITVEYVYRGDSRLPEEIFSKGFTSRGANGDLLAHVNPRGDWLEDSGYVSTSTSKKAALRFPRDLRGRGFLYEVNLHPKAIDVITALTPDVHKGVLHFEDFETLQAEKEMAYPLKIAKKDIKGTWPFEVIGEAGEFEKGRIIHKEYIPNPDYQVPVLTKVAGIIKKAGKAASAVGNVIDGAQLYHTYKKSQASGNYAPFFDSATSIIGGWGGAIALGSRFGSVGATIGGFAGPAGVVVGGVAGSLVGSIVGSAAGEKIARKALNSDPTLLAAEKPKHAQQQKTNRQFADATPNPQSRTPKHDTPPFSEDTFADLFSYDLTQNYIQMRFQNKGIPVETAKKRAESVTKKLSQYTKKRVERDPSFTPDARAQLLSDVKSQDGVTDESDIQMLSERLDKMEAPVEKISQFIDKFQKKELRFGLDYERLEAQDRIRYRDAEIQGLQQTIQFAEMLGHYAHSPWCIQTAKQMSSALNVVQHSFKLADAIDHFNIGEKVGNIGIAALTGNILGFATSVFGLLLPLFAPSGPTGSEVLFHFVSEAFQHVDRRFDHTDQNIGLMRLELQHIRALINEHIQVSLRLGVQLHDLKTSLKFTLDQILESIQDLHTETTAGFEEIHFQPFRRTLREIKDVLLDPTAQADIPKLIATLVGDYAIGMSQRDYHTSAFLFPTAKVERFSPRKDDLTFSALKDIDSDFVTTPERYTQANRLEGIFTRSKGPEYLFGFHVAYAQALLEDEHKTVLDIDNESASIQTRANKNRAELHVLNKKLEKNPLHQKRSDEAQGLRDSDELKHFDLQQTLIQDETRLAKLSTLRTLAALREASFQEQLQLINQKRTEREQHLTRLENRREALKLNADELDKNLQTSFPELDWTTQTPCLPLPEAAREWIETHQALEVLDTEIALRSAKPFEKKYTVLPRFVSFNIPLWTLAVEHYLEVLDTPRLSVQYQDHDNRHLYSLIHMPEETLDLIRYLQKSTALFQHVWRGYANTVLFIQKFYQMAYRAYLNDLKKPDKDHHQSKTIIDAEIPGLGEIDFAKTLLNPKETSGTIFESYLVTLQAQKQLLQSYCEIVAAPSELKDILHQLPGKSGIIQQLQELVQYNNTKYAPFTTHALYTQVNQAYAALDKSLLQSQAPLVPAEKTPLGAMIAPILKRLYTHQQNRLITFYKDQEQRLSTAYFTRTFSGELDPYFQPLRRNTTFEAIFNEAMDKADMQCARDVAVVGGETGGAKTTLILVAGGARLEYVENDDLTTSLRIVSAPEGVRLAEMGGSGSSHTLFPCLFPTTRHMYLMDTPGWYENRHEVLRLLTWVANQVALKTLGPLAGYTVTIPAWHFEDRRLIQFLARLRVMAELFKKQTPQHAEVFRIVISHISPDNPRPKSFIMSRFQDAKALLTANLQEMENPEERVMLDLLSSFLKDGGEDRVFLFDPINPAETERLLDSLENARRFSASELNLVGPESDNQAFISHLNPLIIQSHTLFERLISLPTLLHETQQKERDLQKIISDLTAETTSKQQTTNPKTIDSYIQQKGLELNKTAGDVQTAEAQLTNISSQITALEKRTELVVCYTFKFDEAKRYPGAKAVKWFFESYYSREHGEPEVPQSTFYAKYGKPNHCQVHGPEDKTTTLAPAMIWRDDFTPDETSRNSAVCFFGDRHGFDRWKHKRPLKSIRHSYHMVKKDFPYSTMQLVEHTIKCPIGGTMGAFKVHDIRPSDGFINMTYTGPSWCNGYFEANLLCHYNEMPLPKGELNDFRVQYANQAKTLKHLRQTLNTLRSEKAELEQDQANAYVEQAKHHISQHSLQTKLNQKTLEKAQADLANTQHVLVRLEAERKQALAIFHKDARIYHQVYRLVILIDFNSKLCRRFEQEYTALITELKLTSSLPTPKSCDCDPEVQTFQKECAADSNARDLCESIFGASSKIEPLKLCQAPQQTSFLTRFCMWFQASPVHEQAIAIHTSNPLCITK